jgi:long-chain acyl-CoA synthetase
LVGNICVYATPDAKQPIAIIIPHEANLRHALETTNGTLDIYAHHSFAYIVLLIGVDGSLPLDDLCHNQSVKNLVLKSCNAVGKKNGFKPMEILQDVILTSEEWTPESGLVTAAQKIQRGHISKRFKKEIDVRMPSAEDTASCDLLIFRF